MNKKNKKYLQRMVMQIEQHQAGSISLQKMHDNVWALFELIDESDRSEEFCRNFHHYWDYVEEIVAIGKSSDYLDEIEGVIIPGLKKMLLEYQD